MDIPFSAIDEIFQEEFKEALGFTDIDIPLVKIKPDLILAASELIDIIGGETYSALMDSYTLDQDEAIVDAFKRAIATYGYMEFAPANDIAHTSNGRRMRTSENEKTPFEWMLVKDDDNLKRRAYKAIDTLIKLMDASYSVWKSSAKNTETYNLFIRTVKDYSEHYDIKSRLLLLKLQPGLKLSETREIAPRIGSELMASLKLKIKNQAVEASPTTEQIPTEDEVLLISHIREACAYYALSWALPRMQVQLFPEGILQATRSEQKTIKSRTVPQVPVIDQAAQKFMADAERAFMAIEHQYKKMFPPEVVEKTASESAEDMYGFNEDDNFITT